MYINADLTPTQAKLEYERRKRRREARNNTQRATSAAHAVPVTQTTSSRIATVQTFQALSSATETVFPRLTLNVDSKDFIPRNIDGDTTDTRTALPVPSAETDDVNAGACSSADTGPSDMPSIRSGDSSDHKELFFP